jgi:hypothetical protein
LPVTAIVETRQTSCLIAENWRTWVATDDLNQHSTSKGMIASSVSKNCTVYRHTPQNKIWVSFQTPRQLGYLIMNEQSGFNAEQIKRINIQGVKLFDK